MTSLNQGMNEESTSASRGGVPRERPLLENRLTDR